MNELTSNSIDLLKHYYHNFYSRVSDISLTNIMIWNSKYHFLYEVINDCLFIVIKLPNGTYQYSNPIGNSSDNKLKALDSLLKLNNNSIHIYNADDDFIHLLELSNYSYFVEYKRDDSDYIYSFADLKYLKGKSFQSKRNFINSFKSQYYAWSFKLYSSEYYSQVLNFLDEWYSKKTNIYNLMFEREGILEVLKICNDLNYIIGLLLIDDLIVGFTIIEMLTPDMLVVHIEKANTEYKGAYNVLQYEMLQKFENNILWVNREQDMGIESLRKVKKSYRPVFFEHKYRITINQI